MLSVRASLALVLFAAMLSGLAQAQTVSNLKPEDQVAQLERDWLAADAKGDAARLGRIVADDFVGSSFSGELLNKQDIIPQDGAPGGFAGATPSDTNVRIFGDTAVVTMGQTEKSRHGDADFSGHYLFTDVWTRKNGEWIAVASHGSRER